MKNPDWQRRVSKWREAMPKLVYRELGAIEMQGFCTLEHLTMEQADKQKFRPMPAGTEWGAKWEYAWFRGEVVVPKSAKGERIALRIDTGGESAIFVNGAALGARGHWEREITLARNARGGEKFHVLVETYAGHGPMECGGGPSPHGHEMVPEPPRAQRRVGASSFGIWEEELFQLRMDTETLAQYVEHTQEKESLRVAEVIEALNEMSLVVDLELPRAEMLETVRAGRKILKPFLAARNGSSAPAMHAFGHSHIDVAWLWPLQETERKCCRTFSSQLALMAEYPEYRFLQSQTHLYQMTKTRYPALYERIKEAVRSGQWIADGGMWVEPDTNVTGGESLIRQFIHGKRFFSEEFGVDSRLMWLPDVFGYSAALPQIMAGCGIDYFSTQKIFWAYSGCYQFPYNWLWWEGLDGSRVLTYIHNDYNAQTKPEHTLARWHERVQKDGWHKARLMPFGWGDGGGGPTREHLEYLRRQEDCQGLPKCRQDTPAAFFDAMMRSPDRRKLPVWAGELYFQGHRGTYTSQAKTKKGNRLSEFGLREAELWGAAATWLADVVYPLPRADKLWKDVLLCQFHDIIPGSSIHRVYEEAEAMHANVIRDARAIADKARQSLVRKKADAVTVFNSLSWERESLIELPAGFDGAQDAAGQPLPVQVVDGRTLALTPKLPACGWLTLRKAAAAPATSAVRATKRSLENEIVKLTLNASGEITSIRDLTCDREMAAGTCNAFKLYKDVPSWFDAWDIDSTYKFQPVALDAKARIEIVANGPLVATLRVTRKINKSELTQDISVRAGSPRVEFRTRVNWQEKHKLLKVNFPVTVHSEDALHEIQFGHVRRPTHDSMEYDAARFEVCNHKWTALAEEGRGAALLNDSKYGVDVEENSINLTLLRAPLAPDMTADLGIQEFAYTFQCWNNAAFRDAGIVQSGYDFNVPATVQPGDGGTASLFAVDAPNVIIETVKPAEDGSGDVIVRLYEAMRTATTCTLTCALPAKRVTTVNMLEEKLAAAKLKDGKIALDLRPFEIRTLRFIRG
ncbi:MAG: alpha-mannosidase [Lentisphaerae bacterium]|nr:alpha-mannosidase [Lentisphaerota bacterium]